jgi:hypothetical protein
MSAWAAAPVMAAGLSPSDFSAGDSEIFAIMKKEKERRMVGEERQQWQTKKRGMKNSNRP